MIRPTAIYSAAQVRALDAFEIEKRRVPGFTLMTRAAQAALDLLRARWPQARRLAVVCGAGNNGGDGYVLARLAQAAGLETLVLAAAPPDKLSGDARRAQEEWLAAGGRAHPFVAEALSGSDVIVDGLLGTGFHPPARAETADGDPRHQCGAASGVVAGHSLRCRRRQRRGARRRGARRNHAELRGVEVRTVLGAGAEHAGVVMLDDLGVVAPAQREFTPLMRRIDASEIALALPRRARDAHKGSSGRVLVVGGGPGMPGAARLAASAALRAGAGLVSVAGATENMAAVSGAAPEIIYLPVSSVTSLDEALGKASVVAVGPGLGTGEWSARLWSQVLRGAQRPAREIPTIVDADALNLLALDPVKLPAGWIITPHPGEAARLLGVETAAVQADRLGAVRALHARYGAVSVLKGAGTLVASGAAPDVFICDRGNPGMATAGMGDVLTGVIAGLRAQVADGALAARVAVLVHALAGDSAAQRGQRGLIASDVIDELRGWVNP